VVDPHIDIFGQNSNLPELVAVCPFLPDALNFICADAEFLPIQQMSFDVVHMRSCIDHFLNPELALFEAHRVLQRTGQLIVGASLFEEGGESALSIKFQSLSPDCEGELSTTITLGIQLCGH
jgi:SAM-dependent methyltransferase